MQKGWLIILIALMITFAGCLGDDTPGATNDNDNDNDNGGDGNDPDQSEDPTDGGDNTPADPGNDTTDATPQSLVVHAFDYGFEAPENVTSGVTTFTLVNEGEELHHILLLRLLDNRTVADLQAHFAEGPGPLPEWATALGGPNAAAPGQNLSLTLDLEAGTYAITCVIPSPSDHTPHFAKGMIRGLNVTQAEDEGAPLPEADLTVNFADFNFTFSENVTAGTHTLRFVNDGPHLHEAVIFQLLGNATTHDLLEFIETGNMSGPVPPGIPLVGTTSMERGHEVYANATFVSDGRYTVICFDVDGTNGEPHFVHGMVKEFTIA